MMSIQINDESREKIPELANYTGNTPTREFIVIIKSKKSKAITTFKLTLILYFTMHIDEQTRSNNNPNALNNVATIPDEAKKELIIGIRFVKNGISANKKYNPNTKVEISLNFLSLIFFIELNIFDKV